MSISTIPGYKRYGIDENKKMFSLRQGKWYPLKDTGDPRQPICLHGDSDTLSVTRAKFIFCAIKQINPKEISARSLYVDSSCNVVDRATINVQRTKINHERLKKQGKKEAEERLKRTIYLAQCCLKAINGDCVDLLSEIESQKGYITAILKKTGAPPIFIDNAFVEACQQLFTALSRGTVSDPIRWLIKRGRGVIIDYRKRYVRLNSINSLINN